MVSQSVVSFGHRVTTSHLTHIYYMGPNHLLAAVRDGCVMICWQLLLHESKDRMAIFPIQVHQVSVSQACVLSLATTWLRFGTNFHWFSILFVPSCCFFTTRDDFLAEEFSCSNLIGKFLRNTFCRDIFFRCFWLYFPAFFQFAHRWSTDYFQDLSCQQQQNTQVEFTRFHQGQASEKLK